jgi:translocator protein
MANVFRFFVSIAISLAAGLVGSFFTTPNIQPWYSTLNKPFFSPPNYLFAPVWTILYILMGIAFFLIWKDTKKEKIREKGIEYYFAQLFLNIIWSVAFFGYHSPIAGLIVIIVLWILIFQTIRTFAKVDKTASYLLYPYIAWVSFASILNLAVVLLN